MSTDEPERPEPAPSASGGDRWSWELPDQGTAEPPPSFRRVALLTVAGTVLPGLGLIAARRVRVGAVVLGIFVLSVAGLGLWAATDWQGLLGRLLSTSVLYTLSSALVVVALVWVGVVVASHLSLRGPVVKAQRIGGAVLVGVLAFAVAAPLAVAARYAYVAAGAAGAVFKTESESRSATRPTLQTGGEGGESAPDPWAEKPRLNVLLLGGDDGKGRTGTRTDTVILASIDTATGDTTLFSLPRNTAKMPFPDDSPLAQAYPNGFTNGDSDDGEFMLNAMYQNVPANHPGILGETDDLGADALKLSVGEALGLQVDYYVLINLKGFSTMVDALGGVTLNVNTYIPIGGNTDQGIPPSEFIEPGPDQKLDGRSALWFARGRYGSTDYDRMDRQRCVVDAIIDQANPANMLSRYEKVAKAGSEIVRTDMPQEVLPLMVDLALRAKDGSVRSIVFKTGEDDFFSYDPDFAQMRSRVKKALGETKEATASPSASSSGSSPDPKPSSSATKSGSGGGGKKATESEDVADSCAYDPKIAATAKPYTG